HPGSLFDEIRPAGEKPGRQPREQRQVRFVLVDRDDFGPLLQQQRDEVVAHEPGAAGQHDSSGHDEPRTLTRPRRAAYPAGWASISRPIQARSAAYATRFTTASSSVTSKPGTMRKADTAPTSGCSTK